MQGKQLIPIDKRTFPEIWASLGTSSPEQLSLRDALIDRLHVSRQSVNNWGLGKSNPISDYLKKSACMVVNGQLGIRTTIYTLFPAR